MKLIDKAAVVAEIERIKSLVGDNKFLSEYESGCYDKTLDICDDLLSFLNTLEVKEVDLKKEYRDYINCDNGHTMFEIAKHFFELGIAVGNKVQKGEKV